MNKQTCANCKFNWVRSGEPCESCTGPNTDNSNSDADHARAFIFELLSVYERFGVKMMYTNLDSSGAQRINFMSDKYTLSFQTARRSSKAWRVSPITIESEILGLELLMDKEDE